MKTKLSETLIKLHCLLNITVKWNANNSFSSSQTILSAVSYLSSCSKKMIFSPFTPA